MEALSVWKKHRPMAIEVVGLDGVLRHTLEEVTRSGGRAKKSESVSEEIVERARVTSNL
jgi:hypothetical protein